MRPTARLVVAAALAASACAPSGSPNLTLTLAPTRVFRDGHVKVLARATDAQGNVGTGHVLFTSEAGTFPDGADVTLDAFGEAMATLVCDPIADAACTAVVKVAGSWKQPKGASVPAEVKLNSTGAGAINAGSSGSTGFTTLDNACVNSATPATGPTCCVTTGNPKCGWGVGSRNGTATMSFAESIGSLDTGQIVDVGIHITAPANLGSDPSCSMQKWGFTIDPPIVKNQAVTTISGECGEGEIDASGNWVNPLLFGCSATMPPVEQTLGSLCTFGLAPGVEGVWLAFDQLRFSTATADYRQITADSAVTGHEHDALGLLVVIPR